MSEAIFLTPAGLEKIKKRIRTFKKQLKDLKLLT